MTGVRRLEPGTVFAGDFRVLGPLGEGGMGAVYEVEQLSTAKRRALKLMQPELAAIAGFRRRFELEARVAARIRSDHVVEVIGSGIDAATGSPWLAMELLDGESLARRIATSGPLGAVDAREVLDQLCHALGEAHAQAIIHRDLKPDNIFLATARRRGVPFTIKVLDFGIARLLDEAKVSTRFEAEPTEGSLGTPLWMAPEQTASGEALSPATDVWAIGLIAFNLLTGRFFWLCAYDPKSSLLEMSKELCLLAIPAASERAGAYGVADRIPAGFDAWFERCVARDPGLRFRDAAEAFAALDPILARVTGASDRRPIVSFAPAPSTPAMLAPTAIAPSNDATARSSPAALAPTEIGASGVKPQVWWRRRAVLGVALAAAVGILLVAGAMVLLIVVRRPKKQSDAQAAAAAGAPVAAKGERLHLPRIPVLPHDCETYMDVLECMNRQQDLATRISVLKSARESQRRVMDLAGNKAAAKSCRDAIAQVRASASAMGCLGR